jgi:hypothetical protein
MRCVVLADSLSSVRLDRTGGGCVAAIHFELFVDRSQADDLPYGVQCQRNLLNSVVVTKGNADAIW